MLSVGRRVMMSRSKTAVTVLFLFVPMILSADVIHVPVDYGKIQEAINAASDNDLILVADGTYTGQDNVDLNFSGKAITLKSENGPENCVIDCNGSDLDPHRAFFFRNGEGEDSIVEGFTITNGWTYPGGAIYCINSSSPTIRNNIFDTNTAHCPT